MASSTEYGGQLPDGPTAKRITVRLEEHHARTIALALETQIRVATERHGPESPPAIAARRARNQLAIALGGPPTSSAKALLQAIARRFTEGQP